MCSKGCCYFFFALVIILAGIVYQAYVNQNDVFEFMVNRSFNTFDYGVLCVKDAKSGDIQKYGKAFVADPIKNNKCSASIIINNKIEFYRSLVISGGNVGLGESYFLNYWDTLEENRKKNDNELSEVIYHFMRNKLRRKEWRKAKIMEYGLAIKHWIEYIKRLDLFTSHQKEEDIKAISHHYDIGNDFYQSFLGNDLCGYSCGIFNKDNDNGINAQNNKWDIIINKANINSNNLKVLDIGCGWGYFPSYINNKTSAYVVGITISSNQFDFMNNKYRNQVQSNKILYDYLDYRDLESKYGANYFDRAVSIGMLEHVGYNQLEEYFQSVWNVLKPDSYFLLHYISRTDIHPNFLSTTRSSACIGSNFISTYIFPGGCLVPTDWVWEKADEVGFVKLHEEFFGHHYAKTLNLWRKNFESNWDKLSSVSNKYDTKLYRTYQFYFAYCEGAFRNGRAELVQQLFYKPKNAPNYTPKWNHDQTINPNLKERK